MFSCKEIKPKSNEQNKRSPWSTASGWSTLYENHRWHGHPTVSKSVPNCGCLLLWIRFVPKNLKSQVVTSDWILNEDINFVVVQKMLRLLFWPSQRVVNHGSGTFHPICARSMHFLYYNRHNKQQKQRFCRFIALYAISSPFLRPRTFWLSRAHHVFDVAGWYKAYLTLHST